MTPTRWRLVAGDVELSTLTHSSSEMWNFLCAFVPTGSFGAWKARFDRTDELATALESNDDAQLGEEFDALDAATPPPHLRLFEADGREQNFGLLHVQGERAGFRGI